MDIKDHKVNKAGKVKIGWYISLQSFLKIKELAFKNELKESQMLEKCILEFGNPKEAKKTNVYPKCAIKFGENGYK
jgi:hypothetical protein